jgi:hypothetical protein
LLHAECWLLGATGNLDEALSVGQQLVDLAEGANLTEFAAKTLADLAWISRLRSDSDSALIWSERACVAAIGANTGGAVVSAFTEKAYASMMVGQYDVAVQSVAVALEFESGDDLSPTSIMRLALALGCSGNALARTDVAHRGMDLARAAVRVMPSVTLWSADQSLVGELFRELVEGESEATAPISESQLHELARRVGRSLTEGTEQQPQRSSSGELHA